MFEESSVKLLALAKGAHRLQGFMLTVPFIKEKVEHRAGTFCIRVAHSDEMSLSIVCSWAIP